MLASAVLLQLATSCAAPSGPPQNRFDFERDTFAFANELVWEYQVDTEARTWSASWPGESPRFGQRCPLMLRMARQFFRAARFAPTLPKLGVSEYVERIEQVLDRDPRRDYPAADLVVFPGYTGLREFSAEHEAALKDATGYSWRSYMQRGNWRMIFPFTRSAQRRTAAELAEALRQGRLPIVHMVRFPRVVINHTLLLFEAVETPEEIRFASYDPNQKSRPMTLTYDRATRTFRFPPAEFFPGGRVDVYEIYRDVLH